MLHKRPSSKRDSHSGTLASQIAGNDQQHLLAWSVPSLVGRGQGVRTTRSVQFGDAYAGVGLKNQNLDLSGIAEAFNKVVRLRDSDAEIVEQHVHLLRIQRLRSN